jgi:hypothetical protein
MSFRIFRPSIVVSAMIAIALGGVVASRFLASAEQCLVGRWRVTESTSFPKDGTLELQSDGTAVLTELRESPYAAVWKSTADHLQVTLVSTRRPDLEEPDDPGLSWRLQWKILEKTPELVRLEGPVNGNWPSGAVSLVRQ